MTIMKETGAHVVKPRQVVETCVDHCSCFNCVIHRVLKNSGYSGTNFGTLDQANVLIR